MAKPKTAKEPGKPNKTGPYSEMVCSDCGALGCLIPVPHKKA